MKHDCNDDNDWVEIAIGPSTPDGVMAMKAHDKLSGDCTVVWLTPDQARAVGKDLWAYAETVEAEDAERERRKSLK